MSKIKKKIKKALRQQKFIKISKMCSKLLKIQEKEMKKGAELLKHRKNFI